MNDKLWVITYDSSLVNWIKALKERENHKTILKNKRKTKNESSQSNSKAGIHELSNCSLWTASLELSLRIPEVRFISRATQNSRLSTRGEVKNWRKFSRWRRTRWNETLRRVNYSNDSRSFGDILSLLTFLSPLWLMIGWSFLKMSKMMRSDGDRYRITYWADRKDTVLFTLIKISQIRM